MSCLYCGNGINDLAALQLNATMAVMYMLLRFGLEQIVPVHAVIQVV